MEKLPAHLYPRLSVKQCEALRAAYAKVDQVGQTIGMTNLQAKAMLLGHLAEVAQVLGDVVDTVERRQYRFRKRYHLLTPEEIAAAEQPASAPALGGDVAEGD